MNMHKLVVLAVTVLAVTACQKTEGPKKTDALQTTASSAKQQAQPPVVGVSTMTLGVTVDEMQNVATGWSVRKQILGMDVFNDKKEKVGKVYDIIIAPDKAISYGIISAGGFLGIDKHDVAIPINQFKFKGKKLILPGATKDVIKVMPPFIYSR